MYVIPWTTTVHIFWNYLFVVVLDWGVIGTSVSTNITFFLNVFILNIIINKDADIGEVNTLPRNRDFFRGFKRFAGSTLFPILITTCD